MSQMDFSAYLSHFQLLIKITGTIRSSERLSRHHKNFICVLRTLNLNYYHIQLHYKLAIHFLYRSTNIYVQYILLSTSAKDHLMYFSNLKLAYSAHVYYQYIMFKL